MHPVVSSHSTKAVVNGVSSSAASISSAVIRRSIAVIMLKAHSWTNSGSFEKLLRQQDGTSPRQAHAVRQAALSQTCQRRMCLAQLRMLASIFCSRTDR